MDMQKKQAIELSIQNHKMKIAITGGRGFVGKYLLNLLSVRYYCVVLGRGKEEVDILPIYQ